MPDATTRPPVGKAFRRRPTLFDVVIAVSVLGFACLVAYPIIGMLWNTFAPGGHLTASAFGNTFSNPAFWPAVRATAVVLLVAGVISLFLATVFAWINERTDARMRWAATLFPVLPLLLPGVVLSIGWIFLGDKKAGVLNAALRPILHQFGSTATSGPINIATRPGLIFVFVLFLTPFAYLIISAAVRNIDPAYDEASRMSGANVWVTFARITLGAIRPALFSAAMLLIIVGLAAYSVAATIGIAARVQLLPVYIVRLVQSYPAHLDQAVATGVLILATIAVVWDVQRRVLAKGRHARISGRAGASQIQLGIWRTPARIVVVLYLLAGSVLPLGAVILVALQRYWSPKIVWSQLSLDNYREMFEGPTTAARSLSTSLTLGAIGATIGMALASLAALRARHSGGRLVNVADGVFKAPGAISHIVLGVAFISAFAGAPFYLGGTLTILLLAYLIMNMPQAWLSASTGAHQIPADMLEASAISGASPARTSWRIVLPLMLPSVASGWAMLFLVMVGDLTVSQLLSTTRTPVVGYVILTIWNNGTYSSLAALGSILGIISSLAVAAVLFFSRPKYLRQGARRRRGAA